MLIGEMAPDFTATACMGDNTFKDVKISDYRGKYVILFFYPADFTFVCATEIPGFNKLLPEFTKRNCQILGCSTDTEHTHKAWKTADPAVGGVGPCDYPLIADKTKEISIAYDVLQKSGLAARGVFLIDKNGIIQAEHRNCDPLGRNVDEPLRLLDALQFFEKSVAEGQVKVCPVNWKLGKKGMTPTTDGVAAYNKDGGLAQNVST